VPADPADVIVADIGELFGNSHGIICVSDVGVLRRDYF
jgi:hypothetical protein